MDIQEAIKTLRINERLNMMNVNHVNALRVAVLDLVDTMVIPQIVEVPSKSEIKRLKIQKGK